MSPATPCYTGRAAIVLPTGPIPTNDLSHLCALLLTTATRVGHPFALGSTPPATTTPQPTPCWAPPPQQQMGCPCAMCSLCPLRGRVVGHFAPRSLCPLG